MGAAFADGSIDTFQEKVKKSTIWRNFYAKKIDEKIQIPGSTGNIADSLLANYKQFIDHPADRRIWREWRRIIRIISWTKNVPSELYPKIERLLHRFIQHFIARWDEKDVTPYIHIASFHTLFVLKNLGSIGRQSQQGLEGLNKVIIL